MMPASGADSLTAPLIGKRLDRDWPLSTALDAPADLLSIADSDYGSASQTSSTGMFSGRPFFGGGGDSKTGTQRGSLAESLASLVNSLSVTDSEQLEQLDRENAHFSLSESIIETFEVIRYEKQKARMVRKHSTASQPPLRTSTPDQQLQRQHSLTSSASQHERSKQMIRIRRQRRSQGQGVGSDESLSATSTIQSNSTASLSSMDHLILECGGSGDYSDSMTVREVQEESDEFVDEVTEELDLLDSSGCLSSIHENGLSLSNTSLFSLNSESNRIDEERRSLSSQLSFASSSVPPPLDHNHSSAEWIAYNLIQKVARQQSTAPELTWIVTDSDQVPQKMLPMPKSKPIAPDEDSIDTSTMKRVRMRGNQDWAPPRKQLIFNILPRVRRKVQIARQNFRCAGCGLRIERSYESRMLYCYYTGKYYCRHGCHNGRRQQIPAMVLHKWDFTAYPVSNFAHNLLEKIRSEPLFNILDINPNLYKKTRTLQRISELRTQLMSLHDYVQACKHAGNVLLGFVIFSPKQFANTQDPHAYSLDDLLLVKSDPRLAERLNELVKIAICHVSRCESCSARGFYCEVCATKANGTVRGRRTPTAPGSELIFPFELGRVTMCPVCRACYHTKCFTSCLKCNRIRKRKELARKYPATPESSPEVGPTAAPVFHSAKCNNVNSLDPKGHRDWVGPSTAAARVGS